MELAEKLNTINSQIADLVRQRNNVLCELRKQCKHLRLVELNDSPPMRICADCGAEERGWYCGYHVLVMRCDTIIAPHKKERALIKITRDSNVFYGFRKSGPLYLVGQSHPNFGEGVQTYEQLTEILE
ncbi:MAG: hypothetical protein HYT37_04075 [Candidatus Sungbacteria bacterium]|nr:hypothetical protein [Candidatus Sungbacteria bacterium]